MDQTSEDQIQKRSFNKTKFLIRTLQLVLSVSVFSIFFWYSSGFSIHPQSFNAYFSTCLFSMFTHTLERKYMFLICNGILAFLAKTSLMTTSSPPISEDSNFDLQVQPSNTKAPVSDMVLVPLGNFESPEDVPLMVEKQVKWQEQEEYYYEQVSVSSEAEGQEEDTLYPQNEEGVKEIGDEEGGGTESEVIEVEQNDEEAAETTMTTNEELVNTDELNRKFEEFIRKMKEEMRIEAQRPLIAV
ncbi:hypothetical protein SESBI_08757 [Sesbania bispinosa]|nr:hypothetical protein SESBI_08757 [Sesbania bispinosa]